MLFLFPMFFFDNYTTYLVTSLLTNSWSFPFYHPTLLASCYFLPFVFAWFGIVSKGMDGAIEAKKKKKKQYGDDTATIYIR